MAVRTDGSNSIRSILVRAPNWIGDAVLCLPAIEALQSAYPQSEITVLAKPWVGPVFLNNPFVKGIIYYDSLEKHGGIIGKWRLIKDIRGCHFDMAVLFQNAFEAALIIFLAGIPQRIGYSMDLRGVFLTQPIKLTPDIKRTHQVFYYLNIMTAGSGDRGQWTGDKIRPKLYLTDKEKEYAKRILKSKGVAENNIIIGVAPGASYGPAKRWMTDRFREVAKRFIRNYGAKIIVFGGKDDSGICKSVLNDSEGLNLAGKIDLRESIALMHKCNLFITNDSGPMHIAAALGIPTVAIFGSTDPSLTGSIGDKVVVIKKGIECSPCFERVCKYGHYNCFKMIAVDDVYEASIRLIKEFANA